MVENPLTPNPDKDKKTSTVVELPESDAIRLSRQLPSKDLTPDIEEEFRRTALTDIFRAAKYMAEGLYPSTRISTMLTKYQALVGRRMIMGIVEYAYKVRNISVPELFTNLWPTEVNRCRLEPVDGLNKLGEPTKFEELTQEKITDKLLNGQGGDFALRFGFNPDEIDRRLGSSESSHLRAGLFTCWQEINNMLHLRRIPDQHPQIYQHDDPNRVAVALPDKPIYTFVIRMGPGETKISVPRSALNNFDKFLEAVFARLNTNQPEQDWKPSASKKSDTYEKARRGEMKIQDLKEKILDPDDTEAADFTINIYPEEKLSQLQNVYDEEDHTLSTNGPLSLVTFSLGFDENEKLRRLLTTQWHPMTDANPMQKELKLAIDKMLERAEQDDSLNQQETDPTIYEWTNRPKEAKESNEFLDVTLDVSGLFTDTDAFYKTIKESDRWQYQIGEHSYGLELPTYFTVMLATMQTLGVDIGHNLIYEKQTGSLVPNAAVLGKHVQELLPQWEAMKNKGDEQGLHELRAELIPPLLMTAVDKALIRFNDESPGSGVVRSMGIATALINRDLVSFIGNFKFTTQRMRRIALEGMLFSVIGPTKSKDFTEPDANGNNQAYYVDGFTTALNNTERIGGAGIIFYKDKNGRIKVRITIRKGPTFPENYGGNSAQFENEVGKNIKMLTKYFKEHLLVEAQKQGKEEDIIENDEADRKPVLFKPPAGWQEKLKELDAE